MEKGFLSNINCHLHGTIFTDEDLKIFFPNLSESKLHNSLSYHLKQGHLKRFKRGIYSLADSRNQKGVPKFLLAHQLYNPSFISFESALSYYGLIPEAVYETTSACFQEKKKIFKTSEGIFSFNHSPVSPFFLDVIKDEQNAFLIAGPLRALFDVIYNSRKNYKTIENLEADLRIDLEEFRIYLKKYEASDILKLSELYKKKNIKSFASILVKGFK